MSREQSIRSPRDFHRVRSSGARARSDGLTIWMVSEHPGRTTRLGLTARSKRAVDRNRIRRRVREAWKEIEVAKGREVVVGADPSSLSVGYQELVKHLQSAVNRAEARL